MAPLLQALLPCAGSEIPLSSNASVPCCPVLGAWYSPGAERASAAARRLASSRRHLGRFLSLQTARHECRSRRTVTLFAAQGALPPSPPPPPAPRSRRLHNHGFGTEQTGAILVAHTSTQSSTASSPAFPPPQPQMGSPIFWVGIGVALSIGFSWAARRIKNYALQQAFKTMMQQNGQGSNPLAGMPGMPPGMSGMPPGLFPFPPMPPSSPSSPSSPSPSFMPGFSSQSAVDVDAVSVPPSHVASASVTPSAVIEEMVEKPKESRKPAFTDVDIEILHDEKPAAPEMGSGEQFKQVSSGSAQKASTEVNDSSNGRSPGDRRESFSSTVNDGKGQSFMSVEMLETMLDDPQIQKMIFPYLPEELRDPVTFKNMIKLPPVRQQLQEALNNMGGQDGADMLKYLNSDAVKQQFEQVGLTPEEVVGKILENPDIAASLQNSRVVEAIMDCSQNPLNITKYQNDKEIMDALFKIAELFPGKTTPF